MNDQKEQKEVPMAASNVVSMPDKATRKPPVKVTGKAAKQAAPKAPKPAKTAPAGGRPRQAGGKFDQFGFREGSLKSKAAAMYASKKGATADQVKAELGSVQLNLITELEKAGHVIDRTKVNGKGNRDVTNYRIVK